MDVTPRRVLFLCTQNACRSQMAELWARHLLGEELEVASAGTNPDRPNPLMLEVMREAGVDVRGARSVHVEELLERPWDRVITLCDSAAESCPPFPGSTEVVHHPFPDPAEARGSEDEVLERFRSVRDEIRDFVAALTSR